MNTSTTKEGVEQKDYEVALLLPHEEFLPQILKTLSKHKIEVKLEGTLKKIRLAYAIANAKEACFVFFHVTAFPNDIKLLEAELKINSQILRFLILRLPGTRAERDEASKRAGRPPYRRSAAGVAPAPSAEPRQPQTLSNEALEKKIEEILQ